MPEQEELLGYLSSYKLLCGTQYFRKMTLFEIKLRDFFLHYDPKKLLSIPGLAAELSEEEIIAGIKADYNFDLRLVAYAADNVQTTTTASATTSNSTTTTASGDGLDSWEKVNEPEATTTTRRLTTEFPLADSRVYQDPQYNRSSDGAAEENNDALEEFEDRDDYVDEYFVIDDDDI